MLALILAATLFTTSVESSRYPSFFYQSNVTTSDTRPVPFIRQRTDSDFSSIKAIGPLARVVKNFNTPLLPCCRDRFGEQSCQALRRTQPAQFEKRCLNDHDFNTISCCAECRKYIKFHNIHPENSKSLLRAPVVCRDKHSLSFCRRFKASGMGKFSCGDAEFAVRVCRHTCGYCNDALYDGKNVSPLCAANVASSLGPNYSFLRSRLY